MDLLLAALVIVLSLLLTVQDERRTPQSSAVHVRSGRR